MYKYTRSQSNPIDFLKNILKRKSAVVVQQKVVSNLNDVDPCADKAYGDVKQ